jgi:hypothetical protein
MNNRGFNMIGRRYNRLIYTLIILGAACGSLQAEQIKPDAERLTPEQKIASEKLERDRSVAESIAARDAENAKLAQERAAAEKAIDEDRQMRLRAEARERSFRQSELEGTESTLHADSNRVVAAATVPVKATPAVKKAPEPVQEKIREERVVPEVAAHQEPAPLQTAASGKAPAAAPQLLLPSVQEKAGAKTVASAGAVSIPFVPARVDSVQGPGGASYPQEVLTIGEVRRILATSKDFAGKNLAGLVMDRFDFSGANLTGANLQNTDLYHADFSKANLSRANLKGAALEMADFSGANLQGAKLSQASLFFSNLQGADLEAAQLRNCYAAGAKLHNANLKKADMKGTYLAGATYESTANDTVAALEKPREPETAQSIHPPHRK